MNKNIDVVFDGPPGPESGRFVEVERDGKSISIGEWVQREDGLWALRIPDPEGLYGAIRHVLNRAQTDPEFRWHMLDTESMAKLIAAEAAYLGHDLEETTRKRSEDAQPEYRKRRPECACNRDRVRDLELLLEQNGIEIPPRT